MTIAAAIIHCANIELQILFYSIMYRCASSCQILTQGKMCLFLSDLDLGKPYVEPSLTVQSKKVNVVNRFIYFGGTLS